MRGAGLGEQFAQHVLAEAASGEHLGIDYLQFQQVGDLRSRMPQPEEAERLAIAPGTPVVEICRVALAADDTPVEVSEMTADSSAYIFRYEFDGR